MSARVCSGESEPQDGVEYQVARYRRIRESPQRYVTMKKKRLGFILLSRLPCRKGACIEYAMQVEHRCLCRLGASLKQRHNLRLFRAINGAEFAIKCDSWSSGGCMCTRDWYMACVMHRGMREHTCVCVCLLMYTLVCVSILACLYLLVCIRAVCRNMQNMSTSYRKRMKNSTRNRQVSGPARLPCHPFVLRSLDMPRACLALGHSVIIVHKYLVTLSCREAGMRGVHKAAVIWHRVSLLGVTREALD